MDTAILGAAAGIYARGCAVAGIGNAFTAGASAVEMSCGGVGYSCALMLVSEVANRSKERWRIYLKK